MLEAEMFAILEQKGWTKERILSEDPWYIRNVVFHPRDKDGLIATRKKKPTGVTLTQKEAFYLRAKKLCLPNWRIEQMYEEELAQHDKAQNEMLLKIAEMRRKLG